MSITPKIKTVIVLGGTGLLGRYVIHALIESGYHVRVLTRRLKNANHLLPLPEVHIVEADILNQPRALSEHMSGCYALINLIGILHGGRSLAHQPYSPLFKQAHVDLPRHIATLASEKSLARIVHVSALGVDGNNPYPAASQYLRSKKEGEAMIHQSNVPWTIFRPSAILSPHAPFTRMLQNCVMYLPIIVLPAADFKIQPVYAGDVAQAIVTAIQHPKAQGKTYTLGGPQVFTMAELVYRFAWYQRVNRIVLKMPYFMTKMMALCLEWTPFPIITRDQLASMSIDNTTLSPFPFGIKPLPIDQVYKEHSALQDLSRLRQYARR